MAAETTGFLIEGTVYPVPSIDSFDMDEYQVLYDYSGLTVQNFVQPENETAEEAEEREKLYDNPGLLRTMMHVAYQRGNPELKPAKVKALIGKAKIIDAFSTLSDDEQEDDAQVPPVSTTKPEHSSPTGSVVSNGSSGDDSLNGSETPGSHPEATGTGRSDTSSPPLALSTLGV